MCTMILDAEAVNSPDGVLKVLHVFLGVISLLLVGFSYVHHWALDTFLIVVASCCGSSCFNLILNCFFRRSIVNNRVTRLMGSTFHLIAGSALTIVGINLVGWSEYDEGCRFKCPTIYYIGVAKILTFINGTLYIIHGFLEARGEDEEDFLPEEGIPLILQVQVQLQPPTPPLHSQGGSQQAYQPHSSRSSINSYTN